MHRRFLTRIIPMAGLVAAALAACSDPLDVQNEDNPDVDRAYGSIADVEAIVGALLQQMHQGMYGSTANLVPGAMSMSLETSSQLGNFSMGTRGAIPRTPIDNGRGNSGEADNFRTFDHLSRNARSAANALTALDRFAEEGTSLGSASRDAAARSFAQFTLGFAIGHVALLYDSVAVPMPGMTSTDVPPLVGANEAMAQAIAMLDAALATANSPAATTGAAGWPLPADWVAAPSGVGPTLDEWGRIIRSFRARFRAGLGRTPDARAAADWNAILTDATTGITVDFSAEMTGSNGWTNSWWNQAAVSTGWHQMTPFIIGMADTTGAYDAWLATALDLREPFLIRTPDKRFPSGDTRAAQQAVASGRVPPEGSGLYFRNRPSGEDTPSFAWGTSYYDHFRYWDYRANSQRGINPMLTVAEVDMLAAEAYIRLGQVPQAAALIDKYRVPNGLPVLSGVVTTATQEVPGGNACVPRVPVAPAYTSTACGNIMEAMKWEKRMETAFNGYASWFVDSRGWGDLVEATPLEWPVPYQEMDARGLSFYNSQTGAARGTYGF